MSAFRAKGENHSSECFALPTHEEPVLLGSVSINCSKLILSFLRDQPPDVTNAKYYLVIVVSSILPELSRVFGCIEGASCSRHGFLHQRMNANGSDTK